MLSVMLFTILFACNVTYSYNYQMYPDDSYGSFGDIVIHLGGTSGTGSSRSLRPNSSYDYTEYSEIAPNDRYVDRYLKTK